MIILLTIIIALYFVIGFLIGGGLIYYVSKKPESFLAEQFGTISLFPTTVGWPLAIIVIMIFVIANFFNKIETAIRNLGEK